MTYKLTLANIISWFFGFLFFSIGLVNVFWGNDQAFGAMIILLSFLYFPPATTILKEWTGISIHWALKVVLGILIILSAMGVGELPAKVDMMIGG